MPDTRAILNPGSGAGRFTLVRHPPSEALARYVQWYWITRWSLDAPFEQELIPNPAVNVVVGSHRPGIWGPHMTRFVAALTGTGAVIGALFHPGGFHPWLARDIAEIANTSLPLAALFTEPALDTTTDAAMIRAMESMLLERPPVADANIALATRAVELARTDPQLSRSADLATRMNTSPRNLERLFRRYVGVPPKWVVRRFRVQEACERAKTGEAPHWSQLANELGYFDQSHFIRDFKEQVGRTPTEYAAWCAAR
jgi:AraC-like DNA-binding protein